jgi:hypothetical protein
MQNYLSNEWTILKKIQKNNKYCNIIYIKQIKL